MPLTNTSVSSESRFNAEIRWMRPGVTTAGGTPPRPTAFARHDPWHQADPFGR